LQKAAQPFLQMLMISSHLRAASNEQLEIRLMQALFDRPNGFREKNGNTYLMPAITNRLLDFYQCGVEIKIVKLLGDERLMD
jgi:hypothetical protein